MHKKLLFIITLVFIVGIVTSCVSTEKNPVKPSIPSVISDNSNTLPIQISNTGVYNQTVPLTLTGSDYFKSPDQVKSEKNGILPN